jgi:glyoxylase-like metal-dependent hydrolase (beta-lactamase superfamily II)
VPTPGHTLGHRSLVVETAAGRVVLAGQAVSGATDYGRAL